MLDLPLSGPLAVSDMRAEGIDTRLTGMQFIAQLERLSERWESYEERRIVRENVRDTK